MTARLRAYAGAGFRCWRLGPTRFAQEWDSGNGGREYGGRWHPAGTACVYASLDAATAILEVAVHKTFRALNRVPHTLTCFEILRESDVRIVAPDDVPNRHWLGPTAVSSGQQEFGAALLEGHKFAAVPSVVAPESWNVMFDPLKAAGAYKFVSHRRFNLDPRFDPVSRLAAERK